MDQLARFLVPAAFFGIAVPMILIVTRLARGRVEAVARGCGATEVKRGWILGTSVKGLWQGYRTVWELRDKPEGAIVEIAAATPARLLIARKKGWFLKLFGPPSIELPQYGNFDVRGDDIMLAERVLSDEAIRALLGRMDRRLDQLEFEVGVVRVQRISGRGVDRTALLAEAFELASTVVKKLGLMPAG
jgi:hypothetical protein